MVIFFFLLFIRIHISYLCSLQEKYSAIPNTSALVIVLRNKNPQRCSESFYFFQRPTKLLSRASPNWEDREKTWQLGVKNFCQNSWLRWETKVRDVKIYWAIYFPSYQNERVCDCSNLSGNSSNLMRGKIGLLVYWFDSDAQSSDHNFHCSGQPLWMNLMSGHARPCLKCRGPAVASNQCLFNLYVSNEVFTLTFFCYLAFWPCFVH